MQWSRMALETGTVFIVLNNKMEFYTSCQQRVSADFSLPCLSLVQGRYSGTCCHKDGQRDGKEQCLSQVWNTAKDLVVG